MKKISVLVITASLGFTCWTLAADDRTTSQNLTQIILEEKLTQKELQRFDELASMKEWTRNQTDESMELISKLNNGELPCNGAKFGMSVDLNTKRIEMMAKINDMRDRITAKGVCVGRGKPKVIDGASAPRK